MNNITFGKISLLEKVMFAKHLSVMIKAGMGMDSALETIASNSKPLLKKRILAILEDIKEGKSLGDSLKKYPKDFDNLFVNMISVGESGGTLAKNLEILSEEKRKSYELKNKIRAASIYPILIILSIFGLVMVVSIFVLPKIVKFFINLKVDLPLSTKILISVSGFMADNYIWILLGIIILIIVIKIMLKIKATRFYLHSFILKIPILGKIIKNINIVLFTRTLGSLLNSGISIDKGLQIVTKTVTNDVYKKQSFLIYHSVLKGNSLTDSFKEKKYFPVLVNKMAKVGERSGNLSETLDYLANFYEEEVDNATKNLSTILEPALLIFIGLVVGFVAMSIINPIYELTSKVGG